MKSKPVILHTDDKTNYREFTQEDFARLGIDVESFSTSEEALEAAKQKTLPNEPYYDAVLADYDTQSNMDGGQLIAALVKSQLDGNPLVKEILVLSSSAVRFQLINGLKNALIAEGLNERQVENFIGTIQIFGKLEERRLAELYIALHTLHPDETKEITRADMVQWAGFKLRDNGDVMLKSYSDLDDALAPKMRLLGNGNLTLPTIINEINSSRIQGEGKAPGFTK